MKTALLLALVVALAIVVPSRSNSCKTEEERCKENECCVEFGPFGRCRPLQKEGDKCPLVEMKSTLHKHVHLMMCPCGEGLQCEEDGSGSTLQGRCVQK